MQTLPDEIHLHIHTYLCPNHLAIFNRASLRIATSNQVWGPITWDVYKVAPSINYFEEFKWQQRVAKHQMQYKRRWTLGCVGKFEPLGSKPVQLPADTIWEPYEDPCTT